MMAQTPFIPSAMAVATRLGNETVLLQIGNATYYGLDEVGTAVWEALQGGATCAAICDAIAMKFSVGPEVDLQADVSALLQDLLAHGLINSVPAGAR
jgi:hypothetical protein